MNSLDSLRNIVLLVGLFAFLYGLYSLSISIIIEGLFLLWLGFQLTLNSLERYRLHMA